jgi:hypothetical protein
MAGQPSEMGDSCIYSASCCTSVSSLEGLLCCCSTTYKGNLDQTRFLDQILDQIWIRFLDQKWIRFGSDLIRLGSDLDDLDRFGQIWTEFWDLSLDRFGIWTDWDLDDWDLDRFGQIWTDLDRFGILPSMW